MRYELLALPFLVPPLVHRLYQPINEAWTVKTFGCGCPPLAGGWSFNANHFNLILWCVVCLACAIGWWRALRPEGADVTASRSPAAFLVGVGALVVMCLFFWERGVRL